MMADGVKRWRLVILDDDDIQHVLPIGDLVEHEMSDECVCGPSSECIPRSDTDRPDVWQYAHQALDGRE